MMDLNLLTGGALAILVASIAAGWRQVRSIWLYVSSYAIVRVNIDGIGIDFITTWLAKNGKRSPFGVRSIGSTVVTMQSTLASEWHAFDSLTSGGLFWVGWRPIWVSGAANTSAKSEDGRDSRATRCMSLIRGTVDVDALIIEAYKFQNSRKANSRYTVRRFTGKDRKMAIGDMFSNSSSGQPATAQAIKYGVDWSGMRLITCSQDEVEGGKSENILTTAGMALTRSQIRLRDDFERWYKSRNWYIERSIPWKFGATLHGLPGTGKTSFARAMAMEFDLPLFVFDLSTMSSQELCEYWDIAKASSPGVVVFDDIDAVFNQTETVDKAGNLSFDVFLQCLSGVVEVDGLAVFITTNYLDRIAPSLLRPGRAGRVVEFTLCDKARACMIVDRILRDLSSIHRERVADLCSGKSPDVVTYACTQIMLQLELGATVDDALSTVGVEIRCS